MLGESHQKRAPYLHVTPVSLKTELVLQKCEKGVAVCLIPLWRDIVQTRLS
jgi:hypothetical protein